MDTWLSYRNNFKGFTKVPVWWVPSTEIRACPVLDKYLYTQMQVFWLWVRPVGSHVNWRTPFIYCGLMTPDSNLRVILL